MNTHTFTSRILALAICCLALNQNLATQSCNLQAPVIHIDFGAGSRVPEFNATSHANYRRVTDNCPADGYYSYTNYTSRCFNNDWFTLHGDHTGNGGNMMLVNASESGGSFFNTILNGLKESTEYELAVWLMNVCRIHGGCNPLPPNIHISLITFTGIKVAEFATGKLPQSAAPHWRRYAAMFTVPPGETLLGVTMTNMTTGGCGNDFAMDDITVRECVRELPITIKGEKEKTVEPETKKPIEEKKETVNVPKQKTSPAPKRDPELVVRPATTHIPDQASPVVRPLPQTAIIPKVISGRENPVVKAIKTMAGEIQIELYDNGQIDGDTISIYHNNVLVVSRAGLSQSPISLKIVVDAKQPHHELVMVAENLGSIPPNTSVMIMKINGKRYDVFISSSEQKNAKILVDLEE